MPLTRSSRDVGRDAGEHVVAREQQAGALLGEAQVARRVPRGVDGAQRPAGQVREVAVLEQAVGDRHAREGRQPLDRPDVGHRVVPVGAERHQELDLRGGEGGRVPVRGEATTAASAGCMATQAPEA